MSTDYRPVTQDDDLNSKDVLCSNCKGTGKAGEGDCPKCEGSGALHPITIPFVPPEPPAWPTPHTDPAATVPIAPLQSDGWEHAFHVACVLIYFLLAVIVGMACVIARQAGWMI